MCKNYSAGKMCIRDRAISVRGPIGGLEKLDARDVQAIYRLACEGPLPD